MKTRNLFSIAMGLAAVMLALMPSSGIAQPEAKQKDGKFGTVGPEAKATPNSPCLKPLLGGGIFHVEI